jgi:hypothetical protein
MAHDYYVLYDKQLLTLYSISGYPFTDIRETQSVALIQEEDGESFITHNKSLHDYIVKVTDNVYAELIFKNSELLFKKKNVPDHIVKDLNYRISFFSCLDIQATVQDNKLILEFDLDSLYDSYRSNFLNIVNKDNGVCIFYVTEHNDPTALIKTIEVDLYQLYKQKRMEFDFPNKKISVWAIRK